jgi:hypothetical protein
MPDRVAVNRIIRGTGDDRKVIMPGQRFKSEEFEVDAAELKSWDETGVVRKPRDQVEVAVPEGAGPREPTVEDRSGSITAGDATSDMPNKLNPRVDRNEPERNVPRRGRHAENPDDI